MHSIARSSLSWVSNETQDPNDSTDTLTPALPNRRYSMAALIGATLRSAHRDPSLGHQRLGIGDRVLAEVEDRRRQHGVGTALGDAVGEVGGGAAPAAGDDGHVDGRGHGPRELEVEALLRAVAVHRREED